MINKYKAMPVQVKASFWFLVCTVLQRGITIVTTPIFTRILDTSEYGQYSVFNSWMGILTCIVTLNLYQGIYQQAIIKFSDRRDDYAIGSQMLTMVMTIVWLCVYLLFKETLNKFLSLNTFLMVMMFFIMWNNAIFGFWSTEQRVEYKYKKLVIVALIEAILQPTLCIVLSYNISNKVNGIVLGIAIATFVSYCPLLCKTLHKAKKIFDFTIWKYMLKMGIPLVLHYISAVLLNSSDRIMIDRLVGSSEAGIYNLAYTISICGTLINQAVLQTFSPWLLSKIKEKKIQEIPQITYVTLIGVGLVNLLIILMAPEIVSIFAPKTYGKAIWVMPLVTMSVFFMFMYNLFSTFEFYYEKTSYVSTATIIGAVTNIVLNYVFIRIYGYYAAGYTTLFCYIVFAVAHYYFMKKICKKEFDGQNVYNVKLLIIISLLFMLLGFLTMCTYKIPKLRYTIAVAAIVICVVKRGTIVKYFNNLFRKNL